MASDTHLKRAPSSHLPRTVALLLLFVFVGALGVELGWRAIGVEPMLRDTPERWSLEVTGAEETGGRAVTLIGTSRMQLGVDPAILEAELGRPTFQIGMYGGAPLPILGHFAREGSLRGSLVVEFMPERFVRSRRFGRRKSRTWLRTHRQRPLLTPLELGLREPLQRSLASLNPHATLRNLIRRSQGLRTIDPGRYRFRADRFMEARPGESAEVESRRAARHAPPEPYRREELERGLERARRLSRELHRHGGELLFVRIPSCAPIRRQESRAFPRAEVYERFAAEVEGVWIHFEDHPALRDLPCVDDGQHLTSAGAARFTRQLAAWIRDLGE